MLGQHARLAPIPAALVLLLGLSGLARAQDAYSWSRYHAEPPLGSVLPEALPPPPSPVEGGKLGEQPTRDLVENLDGTYSYEETGFTAHVDGEGRVTLKDKPSIQAHIFISPLFLAAFGTFDATDMAMRWLGEDPYLYQKKAFLERTFEERARMRERHTRQTMSRALRELPAYLERIWRYEVWPSELRKRVLFALWDECAEDGNPTMVAGGAKARRAIEGFVRSHLAPGTPDAFQPEEIARLNQLRTSKARFSPYGGPRSGQVMVAGSPPAPSPE